MRRIILRYYNIRTQFLAYLGLMLLAQIVLFSAVWPSPFSLHSCIYAKASYTQSPLCYLMIHIVFFITIKCHSDLKEQDSSSVARANHQKKLANL